MLSVFFCFVFGWTRACDMTCNQYHLLINIFILSVCLPLFSVLLHHLFRLFLKSIIMKIIFFLLSPHIIFKNVFVCVFLCAASKKIVNKKFASFHYFILCVFSFSVSSILFMWFSFQFARVFGVWTKINRNVQKSNLM